jgi:hypothetical protein
MGNPKARNFRVSQISFYWSSVLRGYTCAQITIYDQKRKTRFYWPRRLQNIGALNPVSPPLFCPALLVERGFGLLRSEKWNAARLPGAADASPFAQQAPLPEYVRLHVQAVEAVHPL